MFSNLTQNSVIYIMDLNNSPKITSGLIESVSLPRPKYNGFNPTFETVVDIVANIAGERREFKGVPNNAVADFGESAFILAENKEVLGSYINSMLQNSKKIVNSMDKHQKIIADCEEALNELSPSSPAENKAMQDLQNQVSELQKGMQALLEKLNKGNTN